jgi:hypothetical protein
VLDLRCLVLFLPVVSIIAFIVFYVRSNLQLSRFRIFEQSKIMAISRSVPLNLRPRNHDGNEANMYPPCGTLWKLPQEVRDIIYENIIDDTMPKSPLSSYKILYTSKRLSAEFGKHYYESRTIEASDIRKIKDLERRIPISARYFKDYCRKFHITIHINGGRDPQVAGHFVKYRGSIIFKLQALMNNARSLREMTVDLSVTCPHPVHKYYGVFEHLRPRERNALVQYKQLRIKLRDELEKMARRCEVIQIFTFRDLDEWIFTRDRYGKWILTVEKNFRPRICERVGSCASCEGGIEPDKTDGFDF